MATKFFVLVVFLQALPSADPRPCSFYQGSSISQTHEATLWSSCRGVSQGWLLGRASVGSPPPSLRVLTLTPPAGLGPSPDFIFYLCFVKMQSKQLRESIQGLRVFSLVIVKPKIPARASHSWKDAVSLKQQFEKWFFSFFMIDQPDVTAWSFCVCLINCRLI